MSDPLHVVCPHCHTTNRVRQADLEKAPDCGGCHKPLFTAQAGAMGAADIVRWARSQLR